MELNKTFEPKTSEPKWYQYWYDNKLYDADSNSSKKPYTIVIPPPNVTGILTLGHVLNNTIQDLYIRWHRMKGYEACWIPGTDHAGIATQAKVVEALKKEGIDYRELGREKFVEKVWEWKEKYGGIIFQQLRSLGVSVDWRRERFTMESDLSNAVTDVFVRLFEKGLIYRGKKIVNFSPKMQTTISDEEVIHREVTDKLYKLQYRTESGEAGISVMTVRPETIWGDVAVCVNPSDERYKNLIGKHVVVPVVGRVVPVIADSYVDKEFGTGALKITPAHDINDYEIGLRHKLEVINTINPDGTMNELAPPITNMDRFEARKKAVELLLEEGTLLSQEDYTHSVGFSERGGEQIEPFLSDQWFLKMEELAKPALQAVSEGILNIHPEHWVKTYNNWMKNIRDWAISRQLWWGHRIPVYYSEDGRCTAAHNSAEARIKLGLSQEDKITQDEDALDTWFSSWLWPFSVHGWGSENMNEKDLQFFFPTNLLVTGPDIIFFWVARMIMASIEFMPTVGLPDGTPRKQLQDLIPFKDVYFTSIIRDEKGKKLSKSLGNSPDPLQVIEQYGADALRFTIIYLAPHGQDIRFSTNMCEVGRNFANKMWNACRFLMMKKNDALANAIDDDNIIEASYTNTLTPITEADMWIYSRFSNAVSNTEKALGDFKMNDYSKLIYDFVWGDFCDWYVEFLKAEQLKLDTKQRLQQINFAMNLFDSILRLVHPIMPFVTEELWQNLFPRKQGESVSVTNFPAVNNSAKNVSIEKNFEFLQQLIESIRRMRSSANLPPSKLINVTIVPYSQEHEAMINSSEPLLKLLAKIDNLILSQKEKPTLATSEVVLSNEVFVHLEGLIDTEKEREKITKEIVRLELQIKGVEAKLVNEKFMSGAPESVVQNEKNKLTNFSDTVEKLKESLLSLG